MIPPLKKDYTATAHSPTNQWFDRATQGVLFGLMTRTTLICDTAKALGGEPGLYLRVDRDNPEHRAMAHGIARVLDVQPARITHPVTRTNDGVFIPLNIGHPHSNTIQGMVLNAGAFFVDRDAQKNIRFTRATAEPYVLPVAHDCLSAPKKPDPLDLAGTLLVDQSKRLVVSLDGKDANAVTTLDNFLRGQGFRKTYAGTGNPHPITKNQSVMYAHLSDIGRAADYLLDRPNVFFQTNRPDRWQQPADWVDRSGYTLRDRIFVELIQGGIKYGQNGLHDTVVLPGQPLRDPVKRNYLAGVLRADELGQHIGQVDSPIDGDITFVAREMGSTALVDYFKGKQGRYTMDTMIGTPGAHVGPQPFEPQK